MILVDAGPFAAAASPDDRHHEACQRFLRKPGDTLAVSTLVVAEVSYLLKRAPNPPKPEIAFLQLFATGRVQAVSPEPDDFARMAELVGQYANLDLVQPTPRSWRSPSGSASPVSRPSTDATSPSYAHATSLHSS